MTYGQTDMICRQTTRKTVFKCRSAPGPHRMTYARKGMMCCMTAGMCSHIRIWSRKQQYNKRHLNTDNPEHTGSQLFHQWTPLDAVWSVIIPHEFCSGGWCYNFYTAHFKHKGYSLRFIQARTTLQNLKGQSTKDNWRQTIQRRNVK